MKNRKKLAVKTASLFPRAEYIIPGITSLLYAFTVTICLKMSVENETSVESGSEVEIDGEAVQIVDINVTTDPERRLFELKKEALENILLCEKWRDKNVAVLSVAGAFRKGKSFLLNFLIRYLNAKSLGRSEWLEDIDVANNGFPWRGGSERHTTGIWLWSKPFQWKTLSGEEVFVFLMDTQGTFDCYSTMKENSTVFALSSLISSVQVFNVAQNIQENELQALQLFTDYARVAAGTENPITTFQRLEILVRDWSYAYEVPHGPIGGQQILQKRLQTNDQQHSELRHVREHLKSCFERIGCFLMPHPGLKVADSNEFTGRLTDMEDKFKEQLKLLAPYLLGQDVIQVKEICGEKINCRQLLLCIEAYVNSFNASELPEPRSVYNALEESGHLVAYDSAFNLYSTEMKKYDNSEPVTDKDLKMKHEEWKTKAIEMFDTRKKFGTQDTTNRYKEKLNVSIEEAFKKSIICNRNKRDANYWKTATYGVAGGVSAAALALIRFMLKK